MRDLKTTCPYKSGTTEGDVIEYVRCKCIIISETSKRQRQLIALFIQIRRNKFPKKETVYYKRFIKESTMMMMTISVKGYELKILRMRNNQYHL